MSSRAFRNATFVFGFSFVVASLPAQTEIPNSPDTVPEVFVSGLSGAGGTVPNSVFITGSAASPQPFTISRVFARGEIPRFAQAVVGGAPVETQCDVKTRWPDGSVAHALISFWAQPNSRGTAISFIDRPLGNNQGEMSAAEMLSSDYAFGAAIELANNSQILRADAAAMLGAGAFRYWLKGPICSQVIIEDRSPKLAFDLGWDQYKSFHPIFVATFYRGWKGAKVELIGENDWLDKMQDLKYSLVLKVGPLESERIAYQKNVFTHFAWTRWRKTFWTGSQPSAASVDYNLPYLIYSRVLPNFDLSKSPSTAAIDAEVADFESGDQGDINGSAQWLRYFPTTGGRGDIGLFPRWYVRYLYTFDTRLENVMRGNAGASGSIPIHFRESSSRSYFLDWQTPAFGRPFSIETRPSIWTARLDYYQSSPADMPTQVGPAGDSGWTADLAHQPSLVFVPYLITGDWYLLEELQFWAAYNVAFANFGSCYYCRNFDTGFISHMANTRGVAWGLRTLGHAAFLTPDATPEKTYFSNKVYSNIAVREGMLLVRDGAFYDPDPSSPWSWGKNVISPQPNPLHIMDPGNLDGGVLPGWANLEPGSPNLVTRMNAPWMYNYQHIVMGHLAELGFPIETLRNTMATHLLNQLTNPVYNHFLAGAYVIPVMKADKQFFQDWPSFMQGWDASVRNIQRWPENDDNDVEHGYPHIARGAASFAFDICDNGHCGVEAWSWITANVGNQSRLNDNPKWAFVPRALQNDQELLKAFNSMVAARFSVEARDLPAPRRTSQFPQRRCCGLRVDGTP